MVGALFIPLNINSPGFLFGFFCITLSISKENIYVELQIILNVCRIIFNVILHNAIKNIVSYCIISYGKVLFVTLQ